ncbi:MAG: hypothetical protein Q9219_005296 [cf. Caloplaca sp. 3 TL-2023]
MVFLRTQANCQNGETGDCNSLLLSERHVEDEIRQKFEGLTDPAAKLQLCLDVILESSDRAEDSLLQIATARRIVQEEHLYRVTHKSFVDWEQSLDLNKDVLELSKGRRNDLLRCNRRIYKYTQKHYWQIFHDVPHDHQYPSKDVIYGVAQLAEHLKDADRLQSLLKDTVQARIRIRGRRGLKKTTVLLRDDVRTALQRVEKEKHSSASSGMSRTSLLGALPNEQTARKPSLPATKGASKANPKNIHVAKKKSQREATDHNKVDKTAGSQGRGRKRNADFVTGSNGKRQKQSDNQADEDPGEVSDHEPSVEKDTSSTGNRTDSPSVEIEDPQAESGVRDHAEKSITTDGSQSVDLEDSRKEETTREEHETESDTSSPAASIPENHHLLDMPMEQDIQSQTLRNRDTTHVPHARADDVGDDTEEVRQAGPALQTNSDPAIQSASYGPRDRSIKNLHVQAAKSLVGLRAHTSTPQPASPAVVHDLNTPKPVSPAIAPGPPHTPKARLQEQRFPYGFPTPSSSGTPFSTRSDTTTQMQKKAEGDADTLRAVEAISGALKLAPGDPLAQVKVWDTCCRILSMPPQTEDAETRETMEKVGPMIVPAWNMIKPLGKRIEKGEAGGMA